MSTISRPIGNLIRSQERLVIELENSGEGGTVVFEKDDYKPFVKKRVVQFAVQKTYEAGNTIPLSTEGPFTFSLKNEEGIPTGITDPGVNNQQYFIENFQTPSVDGGSPASEFNNLSNTGLLDVDGSKFEVKKGKSLSQAQTPTDIYRSVNEQGEESSFVKRVRTIQIDNNRFNPESSFIPAGQKLAEDDSNVGVLYVQKEFGKHAPRKFPSSVDPNAVNIKLRELKKIGLLTTLAASGEAFIPDPSSTIEELAARGASLAPGLARMGQKIDLSTTFTPKILKGLVPEFEKPSLDTALSQAPVLSYGNVNSWLVPFDGLTSAASIAAASLLILTVGGLIKNAAIAIGSLNPRNRVSVDVSLNAPDRKRRLGSYLGKETETSSFIKRELSIELAQTSNEYTQCVSRGIDIFFGFNTPGFPTKKILENHQYYNVILRNVVRNTTDFLKLSLSTVVNPSGVTNVNDVTVVGNPLGPFELIKKVNSSQLLKFCNILATIGDIALNHEKLGYVINEDGGVDEVISDIDNIPAVADVGPNKESSLNPAVLQSLSRLPGEYKNSLAWGSNTIKSMYLLPNSLLRAEARFTGARDQISSPGMAGKADLEGNGANIVKSPDAIAEGNRISVEDVKAMEEYLDSAYMPFYFHDLRTNEIISFHAFVSDMSDNFSAEYTETDGVGRVGSVFTYKNTKRNISFGFRIVATNEKDFDHMYYKLNKLLMAVYPQYTEGRQVGTARNKFIQPFSQTVSASPVFRIRLGDVWKTNYSKFAVARLFGLGSGNFSLEGETGEYRYNAAFLRNLEQVGARMNRGDFQPGEFAILTPLYGRGNGSGQRLVGYPRLDDGGTSAGQPGQNIRLGRGGRRGAGLIQGFLSPSRDGAPVSIDSNGKPLVAENPLKVQVTSFTERDGVKYYRFTVQNPGEGQDGIYGCSQFNLIADSTEIRRVAGNQGQGTNNTPATTAPGIITDFFNPAGENGNSIIKAFESTSGKGLAGVVKDIRLNWNDAVWSTHRWNARAPMSILVTMDFSPIYDLNPGLDSDGAMTAPIYNVGDTMKTFIETPDEKNKNDTSRINLGRAVLAAAVRSRNGIQTGGNPSSFGRN